MKAVTSPTSAVTGANAKRWLPGLLRGLLTTQPWRAGCIGVALVLSAWGAVSGMKTLQA